MAETSPTHQFFWHSYDVNEIRQLAYKGPVVICGGRGVGKTAVRSKIQKDICEAEHCEPLLIDGRSRQAALEQLRSLKARREPPGTAVFIDVLDTIVTPTYGDSLDDLAASIHGLEKLFRWLGDKTSGLKFLIATSTIDFRGPRGDRVAGSSSSFGVKYFDIASPILRSFVPYNLDPWRGDWKARWCQYFSAAFEKQLKSKNASWCKCVRSLAGGHPALFGPVVERLQELIHSDPSTSKFDKYEISLIDTSSATNSETEAEIRDYVEEVLVRSGMAPIRRSIRRLRESTDPDERRSFELLVRVVQNGGEDRTTGDVPERAILMEEGLLYRQVSTDSGHTPRITWSVPGELIQNQIRREANLPVEEAVVVPETNSEEGGTLVCGQTRIELKGNPWKVLRKLAEHRGEFLPLAQLGGDARNSIQRLREELRKHSCDHLIENEYGRGYRFITRPAK
ncbi:MAG: helix-turn-helix domain-containing protein [Fimbriimonadaceae bacterium]|nr:helix-turn-helix domain-containing protein [Fimbriimonadaceae bacterium]